MVVAAKTAAVVVTAISTVSLLSGIAYHFSPHSLLNNNMLDVLKADEGGAVAGRIVSISAKVYRQEFKSDLKLGQCPHVMKDGHIQTCSDEFEGEAVHLAKASHTVDVTKVQTSEDITLHIMGGFGASVGVLGLASVKVKYNVAVTTETTKKTLNLMNSYEVNKGVITLHHPRPKKVEGDKALFLSEIELGGNELFLVTLEFESEKKKIEVQVSVTVKVLFISITAKLKFVFNTFKSKAKCRIQFKSSWRNATDISFDSLEECIPEVERVENFYMQGPSEIRDMSPEDKRSHYFYYFSSWKASPYGKKFNLALINHDLNFLTDQNTEMQSTIERIKKELREKETFSEEVRHNIVNLNKTLTEKTEQLTAGLNKYHGLDAHGRQQLREIYGEDKAPQHYTRLLEKIIS